MLEYGLSPVSSQGATSFPGSFPGNEAGQRAQNHWGEFLRQK